MTCIYMIMYIALGVIVTEWIPTANDISNRYFEDLLLRKEELELAKLST